MAGANIFVIYSDGKGNVTLSPRLGKGHFQPLLDNTAKVSLLAGSGVANGRMVANVRCENCQSWPGGTMDFTSSSGDWIYASLAGAPLDSSTRHLSTYLHGIRHNQNRKRDPRGTGCA